MFIAKFEEQEKCVDGVDDNSNGPNDAPRDAKNRHLVSFSSQVRLSKREEINDWGVVGDVEQALCGGDRAQKCCSSAQVRVSNVARVAPLKNAVAGAYSKQVATAKVACCGKLGGYMVEASFSVNACAVHKKTARLRNLWKLPTWGPHNDNAHAGSIL